jgi:hypothetical protein
VTNDFYGLAVSRTNQARISSAGKWLRRSGMTVMAILSVLGLLSFYRTYINPPELNIEATTQRTVNEHDQIGGFASDLSVLGTPVKVGGTWFLMVLFLVVALALCRLAVGRGQGGAPAAQRGRTTLTPARSTGC